VFYPNRIFVRLGINSKSFLEFISAERTPQLGLPDSRLAIPDASVRRQTVCKELCGSGIPCSHETLRGEFMETASHVLGRKMLWVECLAKQPEEVKIKLDFWQSLL